MTIQDIENKLKDLESKAKTLVSNNKLLIVLLVIPLLILKYRSVIIDLLIKDSNRIVTDTAKQDVALKTEQDAANVKANQIIEDADATKAASDDKTVSVDWNKK